MVYALVISAFFTTVLNGGEKKPYEERYADLINGNAQAVHCTGQTQLGLADTALGYRARLRVGDYPGAIACIAEAQGLVADGHVPNDAALAADLHRMERFATVFAERPRTELSIGQALGSLPENCERDRPKIGGVLWSLSINTAPCLHLIFDTGASLTALSPEAGVALGVYDERNGFAVLPELPVGAGQGEDSLLLQNALVRVFTAEEAAPLASIGIDGVIGLHAFATGTIVRGTLPVPMIVLRETAARPDQLTATRMKITYDGSELRMPLSSSDPDGLSCLVDTGTSQTILPRDAVEEMGAVSPKAIVSTSSRGRAQYDRADHITFNLQNHTIDLDVISLSNDGECIIGMDVLFPRMTYLDLANVELWFKKDATN